MNIVIAHLTKGGAGKTTIATNLSLMMKQAVLLDFDIDQLASFTFAQKNDNVKCFADPSTREIEELLKCSNTIIFDTGGYDNPTTQALIGSADLVIIPVLNNALETNALKMFNEKIIKINSILGKKLNLLIVPIRMLVTRANTKEKILEFFKPLKELGFHVSNPIYYRIAYQHAYDQGKSVKDLKDQKAINEMLDLVKTIKRIIK